MYILHTTYSPELRICEIQIISRCSILFNYLFIKVNTKHSKSTKASFSNNTCVDSNNYLLVSPGIQRFLFNDSNSMLKFFSPQNFTWLFSNTFYFTQILVNTVAWSSPWVCSWTSERHAWQEWIRKQIHQPFFSAVGWVAGRSKKCG